MRFGRLAISHACDFTCVPSLPSFLRFFNDGVLLSVRFGPIRSAPRAETCFPVVDPLCRCVSYQLGVNVCFELTCLGVMVLSVTKIVVQKSYRVHEKLHTHLNFNVMKTTVPIEQLIAYQSRKEVALVTHVKDKSVTPTIHRNVSADCILKIFHAAYGPQFHVNGKQLRGELLDRTGAIVRVIEPGHPDKLSFQEILSAAGLNLTDRSDVNPRKSFGESGVEIVVLIRYTDASKDWKLFGLGNEAMRYEISARHVPDSEYKIQRNGVSKYCVMISVKSTGRKIEFAGLGSVAADFGASFGLIGLVTLFVDYLALLFFRERTTFRDLKYIHKSLNGNKKDV